MTQKDHIFYFRRESLPEGEAVTYEEAENFLLDHGFKEVRVRHHGAVARIEVSTNRLNNLTENNLRQQIIEKFHHIGFAHVALDLEGFISGKMNRELE